MPEDMKTLFETYDSKLAEGALRPDADQTRAVAALRALDLAPPAPAPFWKRKVAVVHPQGVYFHGSVGRGKTMVMDMFFATAPVEKKRRVHFHAFMLEVHDFLHARRKQRDAGAKIDGDLMACAEKIAKEARLLCFDEFFVKDVADAMILGRLFTALFQRGVMMVMTSNTAPDDLYKDGLQRDRFLPFIALLKERLAVLPFTGETDYRLGRLRESKAYYWPADEDAAREMVEIFSVFAEGMEPAPAEIFVKDRAIRVPKAAREAAWFGFADLCDENRSAVDYLELVKNYNVFFIAGVPAMDDMRHNAALRFITLIDTLYDHKARVVISAATAPEKLYTGEAHAHAFERTVSRLLEMQSKDYGV